MQKWLWHIRWILLSGLMLYNGFSLFTENISEPLLPINGFVFALYFILWQIEGYVECKANCMLEK